RPGCGSASRCPARSAARSSGSRSGPASTSPSGSDCQSVGHRWVRLEVMQQRAGSVPEVAAPALPLMERRRRSARAEIAEVALELFERDGFEATTVEQIAATAGCSPRTFYRYFGTKEGALFHDLAGAIAGMGEALARRLAGGEAEWPAVCGSLLEF